MRGPRAAHPAPHSVFPQRLSARPLGHAPRRCVLGQTAGGGPHSWPPPAVCPLPGMLGGAFRHRRAFPANCTAWAPPTFGIRHPLRAASPGRGSGAGFRPRRSLARPPLASLNFHSALSKTHDDAGRRRGATRAPPRASHDHPRSTHEPRRRSRPCPERTADGIFCLWSNCQSF